VWLLSSTIDDQFHQAALDLEGALKQYAAIWITNAILIEIGNSFSKSNKIQVSEFIKFAMNLPQFML